MKSKRIIAMLISASLVASGCITPPPEVTVEVSEELIAHRQIALKQFREDRSICDALVLGFDNEPFSYKPEYHKFRNWQYTLPNEKFYRERTLWDVCHEFDPRTRMASREIDNQKWKDLGVTLVGAAVGITAVAVLANNAPPMPGPRGPRPPRPPRPPR